MQDYSVIFDVEQGILECWNVVTDIELLRKNHLDRAEHMTEDEIDNFHLALMVLYESKFERLFENFERLIKQTTKT